MEKPSFPNSLAYACFYLQNLRIVNDQQPKLTSSKPLADIMERSKREKPSKIPSPRRKNYKSIDIPETSPPGKYAF